MPWVKIDDHFDEHPKMQRIGPVGWGFWLAGLAYCNRNLTDGFIPWTKARSLCSFEVAEDDGQLWELGRNSGYAGEDITADWIIGLLIDAGLWEEVGNGRGRIEGYRVHDYPDYQPTKAQVEEERAKKVAAGQAGGQASAQARASAKSNQPLKQNSTAGQAKSNPVPDPVPVPPDSNESGIGTPPVVPPEKPAPPPTKPVEPKPRTEKQLAADAVYEHKMLIVGAYFRGLGIEQDTLPWNQRKGQALGALTPTILNSPECVPEVIEPLTKYTRAAFAWRDGKKTPQLAEVLAAFAEWDSDGRPDHPPPKHINGRASPTATPSALDFAAKARELERQGL